MNKITCEICGTKYPDSAAACPICGWAHNDAVAAGAAAEAEEFELDFLNEERTAEPQTEEAPVETPAAPVPASRKKAREVFDYDAVNSPAPASAPVPQDDEDEEDEDEDEEDLEEDEEEESSGGSSALVVILVLLIVALLLVSGFIFWKYYLPNHRGGNEVVESTPVVEIVEDETPETTAYVPCTGLSLVSGMERLSYEGQKWLLHIKAVPEDTTDEITFMSEDESIVTVNDEGRVTAVAEGETRIVITCGDQKVECPAVVDYTPEETQAVTEAPAEIEAPAETKAPAEGEETTAEGEATEETKKPVANGDVTLKLKRTDITFGIRGVYIELALDCELSPEDVTWSSRNANVASVNSKGEVTAVGPGLTVITATYGDQSVECIVRCNF